MQENEIWPCKQVIYAKLKIHLGERDAQNSLGFWDINGSPNLGQMIRSSDSQYKRTVWIVSFAILVDHRVKIKESKKRDKYLDLARELKKKTMEHEGNGDTDCNWCAQNNP